MGIHCIIEPAGTLAMGWGLVPDRDQAGAADRRNSDPGQAIDPSQGDRTPPPVTASKWELRKVG